MLARYSINPWFTPEIHRLRNQRDAAYRKWKSFRLPEFFESYKILRNLVCSHIKQAKRRFFGEHLNHQLPKKTLWKNLRQCGINSKTNSITDNIDPNQLNSEFVKTQSTPSASTLSLSPRQGSFEFARVEQTDVVRAILKIKSKAVGFDGIHPHFIKMILPYILPALTHIFNTIITTSIFPVSWKAAKIIPVLKKKATSNSPAEYRPIAILPYLSKVLEKSIHHQMSTHLQRNNLLCPHQSGFRQYHSCTSALLKVTDDIRAAIDKDHLTFLTLLDFSKAFDTVNHGLLVTKLHTSFGFSSSAANLILSYLSGRKQAVFLNTGQSTFAPTSAGVPQGSILGPLLFTIFINDLPTVIQSSSLHMYADDVQLYISSELGLVEDAAYKHNEDLRKVLTWSKENFLRLNPNKTKCLVISRNHIDTTCFPNIHLGNSQIDFVGKAKNLGVWFNTTLCWDDHIRTIIGKIYGCLRNLSLSQSYTPLNTKLMLAKSLLVPLITYCCEIFCCNSALINRKLQVSFNNITRYVYGLKRFDHVSAYAKNILGCSLDKYLDFCAIKYLHKILTTKQPHYLYLKLRFSQSHRSLSLILPRVTYQVSQRQFFVHAIRLWNALPLNVRRLYNANNFGDILFRYIAGNT